MEDVKELATSLSLDFSNEALLSRALTHRSFLNETDDDSLADNERLEFLGDAVLDFVVGAYLFDRYPDVDEGELTALRAALVRAKTLAGFAKQWKSAVFCDWGMVKRKMGDESASLFCAPRLRR